MSHALRERRVVTLAADGVERVELDQPGRRWRMPAPGSRRCVRS